MKCKPKVMIDRSGVVLLTRASGWHTKIGTVTRSSSGKTWVACVLPRGVSRQGHCTTKKTKAAGVLHVVRDWRHWIGLGPGKTSY